MMNSNAFKMCFEGDIEGVKNALEDDKLWIHYKNEEGNYALFLASGPGHLEIVKLLVEAGADTNQRSKNLTALMIASRRGRTEVVRYLVEKNASVITYNDVTGETALHYACQYGHLDIVKLLIAGGADVYKADNSHRQPLTVAVVFKHDEVIKYLLSLGNYVGLDAMILACAYEKDIDIIKDLVKYGVNVNGKSKHDETPLYAASYIGNLKAVHFLLLCGADMSIPSTERQKLPIEVGKWHKPTQDLLKSWNSEGEI